MQRRRSALVGMRAAKRPQELPPCHPERRARSARSRRTSPDAKACSGVEAPWPGCVRIFRPAAPARRESASDLRKSGSQGAMDIPVHRPCCLWFVHLRVRLTKPPQIAGTRVGGVPRPRRGRGLHSPPTRGDWCRFRAAGRRLRPRSTCGRLRVHEPKAGARAAGWMNVFSRKYGKNFNLCGTPLNVNKQHIISDLRFLRRASASRAASGVRRLRRRQEFQLMGP